MSGCADCSRTDIRVRLLTQLESYLMEDSLTKVLLDKDDLVPDLNATCLNRLNQR